MKKLVLKLDLHDDKDQQKAMKKIDGLSGIDSFSMDMEGKKLTVIGNFDPVSIASKLRKLWPTEIISFGPAKEPEKKVEPKKIDENQEIGELVNAYRAYNPHMTTHYYAHSAEENPNACVIF